MTAPKQVYVSGWDRDPTGHWWHSRPFIGSVEYIRADLAPAWQPIATAPKDGTWLLVRLGEIHDKRYDHWSARWFVARHGGHTTGGMDLGWQLFPGFSCGDEWLAGWMPLPQAPALAPGEGKATDMQEG